jgi:hypothetical protein
LLFFDEKIFYFISQEAAASFYKNGKIAQAARDDMKIYF